MNLNACMSTKFGESEGRGASKYMSVFDGSRRKYPNSAIEEVFGVVL